MNAQPPTRSSRRSSGSITLADVARLAGVSAITVSRALNTPERVSPETLAQVRDAVARTGYVPNLLAGGLASNRSRLVAALVPTIAGSVFLDTVQALTETLADAGYQLMLGQAGYSGAREEALIDAIIGRRPDGIVLIGLLRSLEGRRRLLAAGIPVVETWDLSPTPIDMLVGFSHEKVGASVADCLHGKGYRRPAVVTASDHRASLRCEGFRERMRVLGVAAVPVRVTPAPSTLGNGRSAAAQLLDDDRRPDVIYCSSDVLAQGVLTEAHARGLRVPQQLAVMGFGDLGFAAHLHPALSTVHIDGQAIGQQAARFIVDRAEGRDAGAPIRDIGFALVERRST